MLKLGVGTAEKHLKFALFRPENWGVLLTNAVLEDGFIERGFGTGSGE